ncbi:type-4 ice-structuring protein LS-12-like [Denticeps clupeoides]|uniref:type-4 ice-structuring protein LS-12-like n=1 Tax=Denticeps clupeoides TaxID=299321 RepID=UPI0010A55E92|nr:type-4 ice-structuring protein LS-12-like [Denticeps clupeoides]XP_028836214.1 type-4 ice-structuring protein LS-12-like [Denticeps clupeoides]
MKFLLVTLVVLAITHGTESSDNGPVKMSDYLEIVNSYIPKSTTDLVNMLKSLEETSRGYLESGKAKVQPLAEKIKEQVQLLTTKVEEQVKPLADSVQSQIKPLTDSIKDLLMLKVPASAQKNK